MKWTQTRYSERLNIANGLIRADIHWDILRSSGYILTVNSKTFAIFNTSEEAKKVAEKYIKDMLKIAIKEVGL